MKLPIITSTRTYSPHAATPVANLLQSQYKQQPVKKAKKKKKSGMMGEMLKMQNC